MGSLNGIKKIHMIGIGGCGMSAIAEILFKMGYEISGSDLSENEYTNRLKSLGIRVLKGHSKENIKDVHLVVKSSAIKDDNVEVVEAKIKNIPIMLRGEVLGELIKLKDGIAVAGTHGKTTTSSLLAKVLINAGLDPTVVIGGKLKCLKSNAVFGRGNYMVVEADESDGSFLWLSPKISIITNIDRDHMDYYKDIREIKESFKKFVQKIPRDGISVVCGDDDNIREIISGVDGKFLTYGFKEDNQLFGKLIKLNYRSVFKVFYEGNLWGEVVLSLPGVHNVLNALGVIGVCMYLGVPAEKILEGLQSFEGVARRLEVKGETSDGILVLDDYGHHPKEIEMTIDSIKKAYTPSRIVVIFQPHRFSRTKALYKEFCGCFKDADILLVTSIYSAGETAISDVSSEDLCRDIGELYPRINVNFCHDFNRCLQVLKEITKEGDVVVTIGAGDIWKVGEMFLAEKI